MQNPVAKFISVVLSASALTFAAHAAVAQGNANPTPQPQAAAIEVNNQMISNFVGAYSDVRAIHTEYAQRLQNVQDADKATSLQQEAQQKMQKAVVSNDLSVQEYQQIAQQIAQNEELRSRIQEELAAQSES